MIASEYEEEWEKCVTMSRTNRRQSGARAIELAKMRAANGKALGKLPSSAQELFGYMVRDYLKESK